MVLVDSSVFINYLKGCYSEKTELFQELVDRDIPYGISVLTYQEILQGARNEREYAVLLEYLDTQTIYSPPSTTEYYEKAARLFFRLRRRGMTVRGQIDLLIAVTAIANDLLLLHEDRDFDAIASKTPELKILSSLV
ncbi:MAG: PIN domain-containing protein [Planctomycetaceae bacterium]|nr:PIN domain-containing protein [Planctomycetaceae bacterium]